MRRRRITIGLIGLTALAGVAGVVVLSWPIPLDDRVRHVRPGMTRAEVEAVLGAPPGHHTRIRGYVGRPVRTNSPVQEWYWDEGCIFVHFDVNGRAEEVEFYPSDDPPSLWERMEFYLPW
jgi:hypothetical protein